MTIRYYCRHCRTSIGQIDDPSVTEQQLGFHFLTPEERGDIITYNAGGEIEVKSICDYCKEALEANPELSLVSNPLQ